MLTPLSWLLPQEQKADVKDDAMIDLILVLFGSHAQSEGFSSHQCGAFDSFSVWQLDPKPFLTA